MLTPTRYLWSHYDLYFKNKLLRFISKPFINYLRNWDMVAAQRPDEIIAISNEVKERIKKYYKRDSGVIFPPVENLNKTNDFFEKRNYYLVVSRLVPYKKVNLAVSAFNKLKLPLVVVGSGSEEDGLKATAKGNIKFVGEVTDKKLAGYYKGAKALIMPQEEDLGMVAVEAQFFGTPVIAFKKGGALDTVVEEVTGTFFLKQEVDSLALAVAQFEERSVFDRPSLFKNANRFSEKAFRERFQKFTERK